MYVFEQITPLIKVIDDMLMPLSYFPFASDRIIC